MKTILSFRYVLIVASLAIAGVKGFSQCSGNKVIRLYKDAAPGSETWNWNEVEKVGKISKIRTVVDVSIPTLTVFEADKSIATGTAVIICPGGGFRSLAIDKEGYEVAKWLNSKGIAAFVLKYRLYHDDPAVPFDRNSIVSMAIADGKTAVTYVRKHASEWNIKTNKIGIMGFSAGGAVASGVTFMYDTQSRPDFAAFIYSGSFGEAILPADAPPAFITIASDDPLKLTNRSIYLYNQWMDAKKSAELHIYRKGGHGFGMSKQGLPTDRWIELFYEWLIGL